MGFAQPPPAKKRSEARERLFAAASRLFYAEGINSVGIERIIKEGPGHARNQFLRRAFEDAGYQLPANAARHFVTLRDGAMSAAYLDTPTTASVRSPAALTA